MHQVFTKDSFEVPVLWIFSIFECKYGTFNAKTHI